LQLYSLEKYNRSISKSKVKEISVIIHSPELGWSRAWEIVSMLKRYREAGVKVRAYLYSGDTLSYYLALACDEIYAPPAMSLDVVSISSQGLFFKSAFDKLKIKPNFIHIGNFKSASERFTRKNNSAFAKKQTKELLADFEAEISKQLKSRKASLNISTLQASAPLALSDALKGGFIDGICYESNFMEHIKKENDFKSDPISLSDALQKIHFKEKKIISLRKNKSIAIVTGQGAIVDQKDSSLSNINYRDYHKTFKSMKKQDFDALLFRWNSPGGSALVSDLLWKDIREVMKVKEDDKWQSMPALLKSDDKSKTDKKGKRSGNTIICNKSRITFLIIRRSERLIQPDK